MITTFEISPPRKTTSNHLPGRAQTSSSDVPVEPTFDVPLNQKLVKLAERIRQHGQRVAQAEWGTIKRRRPLGQMLIKAKRIVQHGHWLAFLAYCDIPERSAQESMWIAKHWPEIEAKTNGGSDFSLTEVRQLLQRHRPKAQKDNSTPRHSVAQAKQKSEDLNNRSDPQRDCQFLAQVEEPAVPQPAPPESAAEPAYPPRAGATPVQGTDDVEAWLNSLRLRAELENPANFEAAARLWYSAKPVLDELRRIVPPKEFELRRAALPGMAAPLLRLRLMFTAFIKPPDQWKLCHKCKGKFTDRSGVISCPPCGGHGFMVTHEGDYEEAEG